MDIFEKLVYTAEQKDCQDFVAQELAKIHDWPAIDQIAFAWRLNWLIGAHKHQLLPEGDQWYNFWMMLAGRGAGKTRAAAENIGWLAWEHPDTRWLVTAPTIADVRATGFEGDSGLLNVIPSKLIKKYNSSLGELHLINGSMLKGISAQEPERFRGTQWHGAWHDELAAWEYLNDAWDQIQFTVRLRTPKLTKTLQIITTTPKPKELIVKLADRAGPGYAKKLGKPGDLYLVTASSYVNKDNLSESFREQLEQYEGTEIGRQEIHAEILNPEDTGIVRRSWFKLWPADKPFPRFEFILQSYDPATSEKTVNDPTACMVLGVFRPSDDKPMSVMILDSWEDHLTYPRLKKKIMDNADEVYGDSEDFHSGKKCDLILIENKSAGISLIQDLQRDVLNIHGYNPGKADKAQRLSIVAWIIQKGLVYLPESENTPGEPKSWLEPAIRQICIFPEADHDDHVDVLSQGLRYISDSGWLKVHRDPPKDPWQDFADAQLINSDSKLNPYAQ